ncbi:MAG: hypothetical protein GX902_02175 [Lentisphaerae bacterium]|nr:hypothetical protein [Lentisphaerota bacterium]
MRAVEFTEDFTHGSSYVTPVFEMRFLTAYTRNPKSQTTTQQTEEL